MNRWFRVYDEMVDDPKVLKLSLELRWTLMALWCVASQNDGNLPPVDDIAIKLRVKPAKMRQLLAGLQDAGFLDEDETGARPHNWNGRQFKSDVSNERVKRFRERKKAVTGNVDVTLHVTAPDTDTDTEQKDAAPPAAEPPSAESELFKRGKAVLGQNAGGQISKLLKAKGSVALARATIETASTKENPREYVAAILRGNRDQPALSGGGII